MIVFFFRCQPKLAFSIEAIFEGLSRYLQKNNHIENKTLPYYSLSAAKFIENLQYAYRNQGEINHITGDVHYIALVLRKEKTILTIHDCVALTQYSKWNLKYWLLWVLWYKLPVLKVRFITTISEKSKKEIIAHTGIEAEKIRVIPNFYDTIFDNTQNIKVNNIKPVLLQIGTGSNKNLRRVIEAIKGLEVCLHIVGNIPKVEKQLLKKYNIDYQCFINLSKEELKSIYLQANAVVFASTYEGFGMPIIEAQASKRPIITSSIAPMAEVAGDGACLVNPFDINSIRAGIVRVLENPTYVEELIKKGYENKKRFTIETISAQYQALYDAIINPISSR